MAPKPGRGTKKLGVKGPRKTWRDPLTGRKISTRAPQGLGNTIAKAIAQNRFKDALNPRRRDGQGASPPRQMGPGGPQVPQQEYEFMDDFGDQTQFDFQDRDPNSWDTFMESLGSNAARVRRLTRELDEGLPFYANAYAKMEHSCICHETDIGSKLIYCIGLKESCFRYLPICRCKTYGTRFLKEGYFPTKPLRPGTAFSIELLDWFKNCWQFAQTSKDGFAVALGVMHRKYLRIDPRDYKEQFREIVPFFLRTQSMAAQQRGRDIIRAGLGSELVMTHNSLANRCPADYYREECQDDTASLIFGIDGNQQQFRYKNASKNPIPLYRSSLFVDIPDVEKYNLTKAASAPDAGLCSHNFKAAGQKPVSMSKCDETGLYIAVCRHDVPLLLMNSYAGEQFDFVVRMIKKLLEKAEGESGFEYNAILTYDVACKLGPHIKHFFPGLAKRLEVVVNKFHGFAHELRCQLVYGAIWQVLLGESDGEGPERQAAFPRRPL
ncbi:hypothetical protein BJ508DRAFT_327578 [Ascobolus immersus RN42]|uniref:CxC1-like cysteine cluster associated with KDZ transposases domain-containing protein n=1 Tax=Ascobolus immersus RN42 TaxID=1160509 RepID=A0A3N4I2P7_ASCIM|nr:hypothetical protein BJ508DRAFT_327578 [Ascobolus immersus RN42]